MTPTLLAHLLNPMIDDPLWLTLARTALVTGVMLTVGLSIALVDHAHSQLTFLFHRVIAMSSRPPRSGRTPTPLTQRLTTLDASSEQSSLYS